MGARERLVRSADGEFSTIPLLVTVFSSTFIAPPFLADKSATMLGSL